MSVTCIVTEPPQTRIAQGHREICKSRSNPTDGASASGVTFLIDNDLKPDNQFMLDPHYNIRRGTRNSSSTSRRDESHSPRQARKSLRDDRLQRSKTMPHGNKKRGSQRFDRQGSGNHRPSPSSSRHSSFRHSSSSKRSLKSDAFLQRVESQRSNSHTQASPTVSNLDQSLSPQMPSPNASRSSSHIRRPNRRQSAWSGQQLRHDFDDVTSKYANPETELAVSAVVLIIGSVCLIISFGNGVNAWSVIGIVLICTGSVMLLTGILWYYRKSRNIHKEPQPRPKIYDITAGTAECESMISNSSLPCSPSREFEQSQQSSPLKEP